MADVLQEKAERLAVRARRESLRGNHDAAIDQQHDAVMMLEQHLEELTEDSPLLADDRKEAARRLSDYWGRLGGIYRRADQIPDAIDAYEHGMKLEQRYRLDDSYNLTNWIVLQVLDKPARLEALSKQLEEAIALIQLQVEGPRRDQWWAWADLGLVCLLAGRVQESRRAYDRFQQAGARRTDYKSVLDVLRSLQEQLEPSRPKLAAEFATTIETLESFGDTA
jgi:tetratricopeptide (TPR) repeat protein